MGKKDTGYLYKGPGACPPGHRRRLGLAKHPGQAPGPRIHSTLPPVPTGRARAFFPVLVVKVHKPHTGVSSVAVMTIKIEQVYVWARLYTSGKRCISSTALVS